MANTLLRAFRESLHLSQEEFAERIRTAGAELGEPNECTARTVQRWELGSVSYPRRSMLRAIEHVTGQRVEDLGFDYVPRHGKLSDHMGIDVPEPAATARVAHDGRIHVPGPSQIIQPLTGIWESRCTFHSSSRSEDFVDLGHVMLIHHGNSIGVRSLPNSVTDGSSITMKLELRGRVVTGTWEEVTGPDSYYRGQVFFGAVQMQIEAGGTRMAGAWTGIGRDFDVNTGPWELLLRERNTRSASEYSRVPEAS